MRQTRDLGPCFLMILAVVLAVPRAAAGDFVSYTSQSGFEAATGINFQHQIAVPGGFTVWKFDDLPAVNQVQQAVAPDGTTVLTLAQCNVEPFGASATLLQGNAIYFNPEASRAFLFGAPVSGFGISVAWNAPYEPNGVTVQAFDAAGRLAGSATITAAQALATLTLNGPNYEGFLGFTSTDSIASLSFVQTNGAVWYDNAGWLPAVATAPAVLPDPDPAPVPEPAALPLLATGLLLGLAWRRARRS